RNPRHQTAHFLALAVLLALVDKAAGGAALRLLQLVPGEGGGQQALPGQGQWHAGGVARDPAATPLFRDVGGGAGAAGGVENNFAWVGGHALNPPVFLNAITDKQLSAPKTPSITSRT